MQGDGLFIPKNITYEGEKVNVDDETVDVFFKVDVNKFVQIVQRFSEDRGGLWLHKDRNGVGELLNNCFFYYCKDRLKKGEDSNLELFAILTNGLEWVFFNYSLGEIAKIFKEGFSEETIGYDKINFFDICDIGGLKEAMESLAEGEFPERDESKKRLPYIE